MQPYQEASDVTRKSGELPLNLLKYAGGAGLAAAGSYLTTQAVSRIAPLLSNLIPESFSRKGLEKVDPRFGKFIKKAEDEGFDYNEIKDFLMSKLDKTEVDKGPAKESRNIIEQYSPELHKFIFSEIQKGRKPIEAGALAQNDKRFSNVIKQLMKDHSTNWSDIIQSIYGSGEMGQQQMQPQQQSQQVGPGQQALMQVLQKINQKLGG